MDFSGLKIGYAPHVDLQHPFNLRNFVYYASKRNIDFEIAKPNESYDIILLSPLADLSIWCKYSKGDAKIIFHTVDSYLDAPKWNLKGAFRGLAKYLVNEQKCLRVNYSQLIKDMCLRADAVVCATLEQKNAIRQFCNNVHIILECHFNAVRSIKTDYSIGSRINLVWEGLPANIQNFFHIKDVLTDLRKKYPLTVHIITDLVHKKHLNRFGRTHIIDEVEQIFGDTYHLNNDSMFCMYQWNRDMFSRIVTACDIAIIPLDTKIPFAKGKPENKLLLFWRMGMPTVVSATPAYTRAMDACGLNLYCENNEDWFKKLEKLITDSEARQLAGTTGFQHSENCYSEAIYLEKWDQLFQSVLQ